MNLNFKRHLKEVLDEDQNLSYVSKIKKKIIKTSFIR